MMASPQALKRYLYFAGSVANCFWWFDSKFADPEGTPGDGEDQFALVEDYGAGDDHATTNVPLLIQHLAQAMNTTEKGTTYVDDMTTGITDWPGRRLWECAQDSAPSRDLTKTDGRGTEYPQ
jgi:hypothetical protein